MRVILGFGPARGGGETAFLGQKTVPAYPSPKGLQRFPRVPAERIGMFFSATTTGPARASRDEPPSSLAPPLVEIKGLGKAYSSLFGQPFWALHHLDLTVRPGEVVGLLGPNGSGKSTALRLLLGFVKPTCGTVRLAGYDPWTQGALARQAVGYLPGELRLYENLTLRQMARFLANLRGQQVEEELHVLADLFRLPLDTVLRNGSSGMRRKAALVALLIPRSPLLVLDEPTNTLDPAMRNALLDLVAQGARQGQAILFSSHVLEEVEAVCHRVLILRKGRLEAQWEGKDIRQGRRIRARLYGPLQGNPPGSAIGDWGTESGNLDLEAPEFGPPFLEWLARQPLTDLRIEPMGLGRLYQAIHGTLPTQHPAGEPA